MTAPFLYWAGGKQKLAPTLVKNIQRYLIPTATYHEPFLGSGAVALLLDHPKMVLSDANIKLIDTWCAVVECPMEVTLQLNLLASTHLTEAQYYEKRLVYNTEGFTMSAAQHAAYFIYLNRLGYRGLYRENLAGKFNVPYGHRKNPSFIALKLYEKLDTPGIAFHANDAIDTMAYAMDEDVIYLDPPYAGTFDTYVAEGFSEDHHRALAQACAKAVKRGVTIIMTNSDTPFVRTTYSMFNFSPLNEHRGFRANGDQTTQAQCLLGVSLPRATPDLSRFLDRKKSPS